MPFTWIDVAALSPFAICPLIGGLLHHRHELRAKIFGKKTEATTTENPIDLEKQQEAVDTQTIRKSDSTFTDMHGDQHFPPPPAYQPPTSTHKFPKDCDISCLSTQACGHHAEYLLALDPPTKVLQQEGQDRKWVYA